MKVVHIGPPPARVGGPSGYLLQLEAASRGRDSSGHHVVFPQARTGQESQAASAGLGKRRGSLARLLVLLRQVKRALAGPPRLYRPDEASVRSRLGPIHQHIDHARREVMAAARESIESGLELPGVDAFFTHDPFCAEHLLQRRQDGQRVWMMCHSPMPIALYLAWSWVLPEWDWRDLLELPDVRSWIEWERGVWSRVDCLVLPSEEAGEELVRIDQRFAGALSRARYLLTGAAAPPSVTTQMDRAQVRRLWKLPLDKRVGLYLGNAQPYRGLDVLLEAMRSLPSPGASGGILAVAGPDLRLLRKDPRIRPLGRIEDVSGLLQVVDFVVNVNRFSLLDLSTIEALEAGKPLLLHNVGGNRTFRGLGPGCVVLADLEPRTVVSGLRRMFSMSTEQLQELGRASRDCYQAYLTPAHLWSRHLRLYDELCGVLVKPEARR